MKPFSDTVNYSLLTTQKALDTYCPKN